MGMWRNRNLAQLRAKEQVGGSSPLVPANFFYGFVAQRISERKNSTLEVAGSNPAGALSISDLGIRIFKFEDLSGSSNWQDA